VPEECSAFFWEVDFRQTLYAGTFYHSTKIAKESASVKQFFPFSASQALAGKHPADGQHLTDN
jgi:hypothetical protein